MKLRICSAILAALLALAAWPSAVLADEGEPSSAEAAYEAVLEQTDGLAALLDDSAADSTAFTLDATGDADEVLSMGGHGSDSLSIPADPDEPITMMRQVGSSIGVVLPGNPENGKALGEDMVLYEEVNKDTDALLQPQKGGGVRVLTVIRSSQAPTNFDYELRLDEGYELVPMYDRRIVIVDADGFAVAVIEAPWAFDAQGDMVPASYIISDNVLTLKVDHGDSTVYPVLADPVFTWGYISGTAYFDRQETLTVASVGLTAVLVGIIIPDPITLAAALAASEATVWATSAVPQSGVCLKLRYGWSPGWFVLNPFVQGGHYRNEAGVRCS